MTLLLSNVKTKKTISSKFFAFEENLNFIHISTPRQMLAHCTVVSWSLLNSSGTKSNHFQRFPSSLLCTKIHFYKIESNKNVAINFVFCTISLLTNKKLFWPHLIQKKWWSLKVSPDKIMSKFIFVICSDSLQFRSHFTWWGWVLAHHNISLSLCVNGYHSLLPPGQTLKSSRENKTENGHFLKWKASIWMRGQTWGQNSAHQSNT